MLVIVGEAGSEGLSKGEMSSPIAQHTFTVSSRSSKAVIRIALPIIESLPEIFCMKVAWFQLKFPFSSASDGITLIGSIVPLDGSAYGFGTP